MAPCTFQRSVILEAPIERVFAFHEDPRNINAISPPWLKARVAQANPRARAGETFELHLSFFGLPALRWLGVWRAAQAPTLLADETLPPNRLFKHLRHEHRFRALDAARTEMTDHVTYLFAGGWPGAVFSRTLGRLQFHLMFADRHARTRRWMREQGTAATTTEPATGDKS